uniref:Uncharacterized protein n=1 Tax=Arundo donax TaxID=35708 RepID=A0A0A9BIA1_ARUDO
MGSARLIGWRGRNCFNQSIWEVLALGILSCLIWLCSHAKHGEFCRTPYL